MKALIFGMAIAGAAFGSASAEPSPFAGVWKMDVARSKLTGDTMTYIKTPKGFRYSNGGPLTYEFATDGKDYPMIPDRTMSWTKTGEGAWDLVFKINGKIVTKAHRVLSPDGKTMTTNYLEMRPDGTTAKEQDVYQKVSGSTGLAGEWKDVKVNAAVDEMTISLPAPGSFKIEDPIFKIVVVGKTDGSNATLSGPTIPPGASATYKAVGPLTWEYSRFLKGQLIEKGQMKVLAGGKEHTDSAWAVGKESEKSV